VTSDTLAVALAAELRQVAADYDGYITRRATELAQPLIEAATAEAAERVRLMAARVQRAEDVIAELRPIVDVRDRQLAQATGRAS